MPTNVSPAAVSRLARPPLEEVNPPAAEGDDDVAHARLHEPVRHRPQSFLRVQDRLGHAAKHRRLRLVNDEMLEALERRGGQLDRGGRVQQHRDAGGARGLHRLQDDGDGDLELHDEQVGLVLESGLDGYSLVQVVVALGAEDDAVLARRLVDHDDGQARLCRVRAHRHTRDVDAVALEIAAQQAAV
ncbi:hypothetical protein PoMZ_03775 [Pyricularia oryzae]|uniref:Uncharacterized protein n=1 Tax=Pyricularia oryzae TaxID=318829 RepID=A0A4P7N7Y6_PYROR|nr:hypothetical protein PoMZ_03775 [Pyricularia oryzae]